MLSDYSNLMSNAILQHLKKDHSNSYLYSHLLTYLLLYELTITTSNLVYIRILK